MHTSPRQPVDRARRTHGTEGNFCYIDAGQWTESTPQAPEKNAFILLVKHTDIVLMQALRCAPRPLAGAMQRR